MRCKFTFVFALLFVGYAFAAEWQWSAPLSGFVSPETNDHPRAFLWIPAGCKRVKAIVFGQHNMLEEGIMEHPKFRRTLSRLGIAEVWLSPGISQDWNPKSNCQELFTKMLDSLSFVSGYSEISKAPVIPIGHSAMATFPWNFAAQNNSRTLAVLSIHGDAPSTNLTGYGRPNLDWTNLSIDGIPGLMVMGEYEWWDARMQPVFKFMKSHPQACVSVLCDAGRGHFDYSDQLLSYLGLFIEKAVRLRLPSSTDKFKSGAMKPVDPAKGWLADRWHRDSIPAAEAAPCLRYSGPGDRAFWYFDKETAIQTEKIYARQRGKQKQYLGYMSNGKLIPFNPKYFYGYVADFNPESDGVTFRLSPVFTDSLHQKTVSVHAKNKPTITRICGPVEKLSDSIFRVSFYRMGMDNKKRTADICLMASSDGDDKFKSSVQPLLLRIPYLIKEGKEQVIQFDPIADVPKKTKSVELHATSSEKLAVHYYVREGPAFVKGNKLVFSKIPTSAKFPVKVTIVAWQLGTISEPKIQTAAPVVSSFYIYQ